MKAISGLLVFLVISFASAGQSKVKLTELKDHIGDSVIIEGRVNSIQYLREVERSPTYLYIGSAYPKQKLTVVIFGSNRTKFTVVPEDAFKNKTLRVTGKISDNGGKLQMVVSDPAQIVAIEK